MNKTESKIRDKFTTLLNAVPDAMVVINKEGKIEVVNTQTEKMFGYTIEELQGQGVELLIPERFAKGHESKRAAFTKAPETREMGSGRELYARRKDGTEISVEIALNYLIEEGETFVFAAIRDISERKLLEKQKSFLAAIVEHSNDAIFSKNLEGEIISWNKGAETIFGYEANEMLGKKIMFIDPQLFATKRSKIVNGITPYTLETTLQRKTGEKFPATIAFSAIKDIDGKVIGISEIISDLTQLKQAHEKASILDKKNKELELKLKYHKQLEDFAYICSHNLRAPVGNLNSLFLMYDQTQEPETKLAVVEKVKGVTHNLTETLEELSKALSIKTDSTVKKDKLEFEPLLKKQLENVGEIIASKEAIITWDFAKFSAISYPHIYLESILLNFLTNSLKYSSPNRQPVIHFETFDHPNKGEGLTVTDNGIGIDLARYGKKIFGLHKTFHRNDDAKGVGLFITRAQIEAMGGTITVDSEVDKGTTFTILFNST